MKAYPTRGQISPEEYRERCRSSESWALLQAVASGQKTVVFPPGSVHFGLIGFLIVVFGGGLIGFAGLSLLANASPAIKGSFVFAAPIFLVAIHCGFMLTISLGFIYAQQNLVRYLNTLVGVAVVCVIFGIYSTVATRLPAVYSLFPVVSLASALTMLQLSRSRRFTQFAEIMRAKRMYLAREGNQRR